MLCLVMRRHYENLLSKFDDRANLNQGRDLPPANSPSICSKVDTSDRKYFKREETLSD